MPEKGHFVVQSRKKTLQFSDNYDKIPALYAKAEIGLPCIGLRIQRKREGESRLRAIPGFLP